MVQLFFDNNPEENQEEQKFDKLCSLLQTYNLTPHDNEERRSEHLQAILKHLDDMVPTSKLEQWVKDNLTHHLDYYRITSTNDFTKPGPS